MTSERNYGIDLLRLVLMYMVCLLHILGQGGVLGASSVGTVQYRTYWFLEVCGYCAVDGFALVSGYTASKRTQRYEKIVQMWFQAVFYSFIVTMIFAMAGFAIPLEQQEIKKLLMPVTFKSFWYFTAYFALFFMMPIFNEFLFSIDEHTAKKTFLTLIVLFSVFGMISDPFGSSMGYSAIWLMVLYCLGALAKKIHLFEKKSSVALVLLFTAMCLLSWAFLVAQGSNRFINYVSPTILLNGLILVVLFSRIKIKGRLVKKISPLAFGVYLFQLNVVMWNIVLQGSCTFIVSKPIAAGVGYVFLYTTGLFVTGLAVEFLRSKVAKLLRIHILSKKIAAAAEKILCKIG